MQNYIAKQISGNHDKVGAVLAVLVKRTYKTDSNGYCTIADEQLPLVNEIIYYPNNNVLLEADSDLFVQKKYCDVVIKGNARCYGKLKKFSAGIVLGNKQFIIGVQGNQKIYLDNYGKIKFGDIEQIEEVPLRYDFAYGGKDTEAEKKIQLPAAEIQAAMPNVDWYADSPFRYPRNPEGKGYLVEMSKDMIEQLEIPNLQDPEYLLTAENILVGDINRWTEMPIPYATGWISHVWVPRFLYTGLAEFPYGNARALKEMKMKWVEPDIYEKKDPAKSFNYRFFNGGHYALQLDLNHYIKECTLINIHPLNKKITIKIPNERPKIWVDGRKGILKETIPVMHTILIEPDHNRLSIIWCGNAPALRPYMEEELKTMPFKVEW
ncbi:DUF2169 domain-containing protein [soil metagenome]